MRAVAHARTTLLLFLFGALSVTAIGCDSASAFDGCVDPKDPSKPGPDPHSCQQSEFTEQDFRAREIAGTARRGEDGVNGAQLHVSPSPILPSDVGALTTDYSCDQVGFYRVPGNIAARYDLMVKLPNGVGGRDDILQYLGVAARGVDPQIEVPGRTLPRSWQGHVDVRFDAPIAAGHTVLFLASGNNVFGVTGDLSTGLAVHTLDFTEAATLHAVEYDPVKGLVSASKYGKMDVLSDSANPKVITMHLDPITGTATPKFTLSAPDGFTPNTIDVRVSTTRTSDALLVSIPYGQVVTLPVIPNLNYTYELTAKRLDGATSDSGETFLDVYGTTAITLPEPPVVSGPGLFAQVTKGDVLSVPGVGVIEHVFEPLQNGNAGIRILVSDPTTTAIPDVSLVNEQKITGAYRWTVRRFANALYVEQIAGADARRYKPFATSPPRTLFLR